MAFCGPPVRRRLFVQPVDRLASISSYVPSTVVSKKLELPCERSQSNFNCKTLFLHVEDR